MAFKAWTAQLDTLLVEMVRIATFFPWVPELGA